MGFGNPGPNPGPLRSPGRAERDSGSACHLEGLGYSVWWDADLQAGLPLDREIEREIAAARCVLVVWTQAAVDSDWVRAEAAEALEDKKLVPVFLESARPPLRFRHVDGVDPPATPEAAPIPGSSLASLAPWRESS